MAARISDKGEGGILVLNCALKKLCVWGGQLRIAFREGASLSKFRKGASPLRLLAGQGGVIGALLCTSDFLHPRHSTVPCIMQNTSVFHNFSHGC